MKLNKQYQKEIEECFNKYIKLLHHHTSQIFLRYVNETAKINYKYFSRGERRMKTEEQIDPERFWRKGLHPEIEQEKREKQKFD